MQTIDINCDVGEGFNNESLLMPFLSSCNIACGAHAGSLEIIKNTMLLAKKHGVKIGAHPSFPDQENFGRKMMNISSEALQKSIESQLRTIKQCAEKLNLKIHHVKAHGALYNSIAKDTLFAKVFVNAVKVVFKNIFLYVPCHSEIEKIALQNHLQIKYEVFIDRNYNEDLSLVDRSQKNAIIQNKSEALKHVNNLLHGKVKTVTGKEKKIQADTFCVHGDAVNTLEILRFLKEFFTKKEIDIVSP